jgi:stress-induced morphogen
MPIAQTELMTLLEARFGDGEISIRDLAGDGDHYHATIISPEFVGKNRVQQHQLVNEALKGVVGDRLHALSLTLKVPAT